MVEDVVSGDGMFGMIQPIVPRHDNRPPPGAEDETPELYGVGCAGTIENWQKLPDGRYVLELRGVSRFRSEGELPLHRGYRRMKARYDGFFDLLVGKDWTCERDEILRALAGYAARHGIVLQPESIKEFSDIEFINVLAMALPFHPAEKQALLEAVSLQDRQDVLVHLLRLGSGSQGPDQATPSRTLH